MYGGGPLRLSPGGRCGSLVFVFGGPKIKSIGILGNIAISQVCDGIAPMKQEDELHGTCGSLKVYLQSLRTLIIENKCQAEKQQIPIKLFHDVSHNVTTEHCLLQISCIVNINYPRQKQ